MKESNTVIHSIAELIPDEQMPGAVPLIGKELMLYGHFYKTKLIEYKDRKELLNLQRKSFKLLIGSVIVTLAINRGITLTRFRSFDFMNLNLGLRMIIRTIVFSVCMYSCFYIPVLKHMFECRDALNKKYYPRYKEFVKEGSNNFHILNPQILDDPELTQEEYGHYLQAIELSHPHGSSSPKRKV
jgi:hypothetical protein